MAEALGRGSGEERDERHACRRRGVLSGGIVSSIEIALRDQRGESGERALPEPYTVAASGSCSRAGDTPRFLPSNPAIEPDSMEFAAESTDDLRFEVAANAFRFILADAETDRCAWSVSLDTDCVRRDVRLARLAERIPQPAPRRVL